MRFKLFSADTVTKVEEAINQWLANQTPLALVRLSETRFHESKRPGGLTLVTVTICVWYDLPEPATAASRLKPAKTSRATGKKALRRR